MKWFSTLAVLCMATACWAQDGHKGHDHEKQDGKEHAGEMDQAAMMEAWMATASPGPEHKHLESMVGNWKATTKHWMQPGAEPTVSEGICKNEWILGGRWVKTSYKGDMMGQPFEGHGFTGYDRTRKQYTSIWLDSMSTGPMIDLGQYDEANKTFTYHSSFEMPGMGEMKSKTVVRIMGSDKHMMLMYHAMPGSDKMEKVMEIVYEREAGGES